MAAIAQQALRAERSSFAMLTRHCIAHGVAFELHAYDADSLAAMLDLLPSGTEIVTPGTPSTTRFTLPPSTHSDFPGLLARFEQQVLLHVAVHASHRTFLHAGVVGWQGGAIILPGVSFAGKSTLVAELVKLGAVYYSDEYAVLDSSGMVHPYPSDLRMRVPGGLHQTQVFAGSLSGKVADAPAVVAHVVLTNFVQGAEWKPQPLTHGMAILDMLPHCVPARRHPSGVLGTLKAVMRTAQAFRTARGDAKAAAQFLLQTLGSVESRA